MNRQNKLSSSSSWKLFLDLQPVRFPSSLPSLNPPSYPSLSLQVTPNNSHSHCSMFSPSLERCDGFSSHFCFPEVLQSPIPALPGAPWVRLEQCWYPQGLLSVSGHVSDLCKEKFVTLGAVRHGRRCPGRLSLHPGSFSTLGWRKS